MAYTVSELAELAGVSVRTLHHYDRTGLLVPGRRSRSGYRLYGDEELRRLQQILLFRELDFPLGEIRRILDRPGYDPAEALEAHRGILREKGERIARLLDLLDRTIAQMRGETTMLTDKELYEGFSEERIEAMKEEARRRWGRDRVDESHRRVAALGKEEFARIKAAGEALEARFAAAFRAGEAPGSERTREICRGWEAHIGNFYEPGPDILEGLGRLYAEPGPFRDRYEALAPGLADYLQEALALYAASRRKD